MITLLVFNRREGVHSPSPQEGADEIVDGRLAFPASRGQPPPLQEDDMLLSRKRMGDGRPVSL